MVVLFARLCPPSKKVGAKSIEENKVGEFLEAFYGQVATYARDKRLGLLGRARLAKALQDTLRRHQYPEELVNRLVNAVTMNALVASDRR